MEESAAGPKFFSLEHNLRMPISYWQHRLVLWLGTHGGTPLIMKLLRRKRAIATHWKVNMGAKSNKLLSATCLINYAKPFETCLRPLFMSGDFFTCRTHVCYSRRPCGPRSGPQPI